MTEHDIDNKWDDDKIEKIGKIPVKESKDQEQSNQLPQKQQPIKIESTKIDIAQFKPIMSNNNIPNNINNIPNHTYNKQNITKPETTEQEVKIIEEYKTKEEKTQEQNMRYRDGDLENINVMERLQKIGNISKLQNRPIQTNKPIVQLLKTNKPIVQLLKTNESTKDIDFKDETLDKIFKEEVKIIEKEKESEPINITNREIVELGKNIHRLEQYIKILADSLKTFTDAKSWQAISKGRIHVNRYANYYDISDTITTASSSNPNDPDSNVYNVEPIFTILERYAEIIHVANDGKSTLFVMVSHRGTTNLSLEAPIYAGEIKTYYNVYEIRLRSTTAGHAYRVSEYDICCTDESIFTPIEKANLHNQDLPAANADWLASSITPSSTPSTFKIMVAVSISGNFSVVITKTNGQVATLNATAGPALIADGLYTFEILVHSGDSINFRYSVTGGIIRILRIQEVDASIG